MIGAVVLAALFPGVVRSGGPLHADKAANAGIFLVFFFHGVRASPPRT